MIEKAKSVTDASPAFAASKEIEQVLWKPCFYKRIEDFRRRIRKYATAASASDRSVREHFARVSIEFQQFLQDAAAFYDHVRTCYGQWLVQAARRPDDAATAASAVKCRQSLHRCFIFLGDLARYRELHSQKAKKNFAAAESFYHKALAVLPGNGNPHNQLAVLATYVEAETVAVYRYCRSLLIAQPFATAEENLALLFERARQRPLAATGAVLTPASSSRDKSTGLKSFLHRLTRLHGLLFALASGTASGTPTYPLEMETALVNDMPALLRAGVIGDALLLKVVVINIFCVVRALERNARAIDDAVRLATRTIASVMAYVCDELSRPSGRSESPNSVRLLGPVSVFCDFLRLNPKALDTVDAALSRSSVSDASSESYRTFLERFAALVNHNKLRELYAPLVTLRSELQEPLRVQQLQLKENVELRGFAPFAALLERSATATAAAASAALAWADETGAMASALPEADAMRVRAWNLHGFATFLCDEYEGNPLLYLYQGVFATSPTVGPTNAAGPASYLHAATTPAPVAAAPRASAAVPSSSSSMMPAFELFSNRPSPPKPVPSAARTDDDDDFDDEVIVFQPSPALGPRAAPSTDAWQSRSSGPSMSPFSDLSASGPFSLGAPSSQSTPEPVKQRHSFSSSSTSGFGASTTSATASSALGATLGYPNFHSFGGDFGGFSGNGLLAGWGNSETPVTPASTLSMSSSGLGRPPSVPKPAFSLSSGSGASSFAPMLDLAAVERESALYQQEASSLSAFLSAAPVRSSSASILNETSSARTSPRPPPGFGGAAAASPSPMTTQQQQQFYTRNPFINP